MTDSQIENEIKDFFNHCGLKIDSKLIEPAYKLLLSKYGEDVDEKKIKEIATKLIEELT